MRVRIVTDIRRNITVIHVREQGNFFTRTVVNGEVEDDFRTVGGMGNLVVTVAVFDLVSLKESRFADCDDVERLSNRVRGLTAVLYDGKKSVCMGGKSI